MKKLILLISILAVANAVNSFGNEFFIGGGYDFYRHGSNSKLQGTSDYKGNAKLRAEWMPFSGENNFKAGIGIAHDFGTKANGVNLGKTTPVYLVFKPSWEINSDWNFYNKLRAGWSFNHAKENKSSGTYALDSTYKSGPYAGAEIGFEYKNVAFGLTSDVAYIPGVSGKQNKGTANFQVGFQVGYVFGKNNSKPYLPPVVVHPRTEEIKVPEPEVVIPVIEKKQEEGKAVVRFEFDNPTITLPSEKNTLNRTIDYLNTSEYVDVEITGHTDSKGSDAYNEKLGQQRANHVAEEIRANTDPSKVKINSVIGKGEKEPVADNATDEGRALNRRVEIDFRGWFDSQEERY